MFSRGTSTLTQRALAAAGLIRSFLLLEDDRSVDWEVDRQEVAGDVQAARAPLHEHQTRAPPRAGRVAPASPAQAARRVSQPCLSPIGPAERHELVAPRTRAAGSSPRTTVLWTAVLAVNQKTGGVLLSRALASQVPSALRGLTALFGMGRGVSPSPKPPEKGERPLPPAVLQNCTVATAGNHKKIRQALDPLVPVSFTRYRASRSGLSTWWSTRGLTPSRGWESSS